MSVHRGIESAASWLSRESDTVYSIKISPEAFLRDVKILADCWIGLDTFDGLLEGVEKDPEGPQVNLRRDVFDHLGDNIVVVSECSIVAFELKETSAIRNSIQRWTDLDDGQGPVLFGNYLVFGPKGQLDSLAKRFMDAQPR